MSELERNKVDYFVICINEFAKTYSLSAFRQKTYDMALGLINSRLDGGKF